MAKTTPDALLQELSLKTGDPKGEVIRKALILMEQAVHTHLGGGFVRLVGGSGEVLGEIQGLASSTKAVIDLDAVTAFAEAAHEGQLYGNVPYMKHLGDVAKVLGRFGIKSHKPNQLYPRVRADRLLAGAWLHDVLEDTEVTYELLRNTFGCEVAYLVNCVTNEPGRNRAAKHRLTYQKIRQCSDAVLLKLADRIANVENCLATENPLLRMYQKEFSGFWEALYKQNEHEALWTHLLELMEGS